VQFALRTRFVVERKVAHVVVGQTQH
jgi:hypothetical protein